MSLGGQRMERAMALTAALGCAALLTLAPRPAAATDHAVLGKRLLVKNLGAASNAKVVLEAVERGSDDAVAGDPSAAGATLSISLYGSTPSAQVFTLPAAQWSGDASRGFKYRDASGASGPVKRVTLRRSAAGKFVIDILINGHLGPINLVPPNPGSAACARLDLTGGDSYSVRFADGTMTNKGERLFR